MALGGPLSSSSRKPLSNRDKRVGDTGALLCENEGGSKSQRTLLGEGKQEVESKRS